MYSLLLSVGTYLILGSFYPLVSGFVVYDLFFILSYLRQFRNVLFNSSYFHSFLPFLQDLPLFFTSLASYTLVLLICHFPFFECVLAIEVDCWIAATGCIFSWFQNVLFLILSRLVFSLIFIRNRISILLNFNFCHPCFASKF